MLLLTLSGSIVGVKGEGGGERGKGEDGPSVGWNHSN